MSDYHHDGGLPASDELFGNPGDPDASIAQVRHDAQMPSGRPIPPGRDPEIRGLAQGLGLR